MGSFATSFTSIVAQGKQWTVWPQSGNKPFRSWQERIDTLCIHRPQIEILNNQHRTCHLEAIIGVYQYSLRYDRPESEDITFILTRHVHSVDKPWKYPYEDQLVLDMYTNTSKTGWINDALLIVQTCKYPYGNMKHWIRKYKSRSSVLSGQTIIGKLV